MRARVPIDFPWTIGLGALAVLATAAAPAWLVADLHRVQAGELWRLATGPLVHANAGHLLRDLAVCMVLGTVYERQLGARWPWILLGGLALPTMGVFVFEPGLEVYYGLSGTAHVLMTVAVVHEWLAARGRPAWWIVLITLAYMVKIAFEALASAPMLPMDLGPGIRPVPLAHVAGALAGLGVLLARRSPPAKVRTA